jgi:hypothetical protein
MTAAVKDHKNLCLMVDHTNFVKGLRDEVIVQIPSPFSKPHAAKKGTVEEVQVQDIPSSSATRYAKVADNEDVVDANDDETDSEFYDSDYDADGDDIVFFDNIDTDVNNNNKQVQITKRRIMVGLIMKIYRCHLFLRAKIYTK